ncbi:LPS export ABC transporter permease LptF [Lacibacterium aquatile]|uniref:LPS export ABC transporter permease LptF n=1 Tax=Lacibacterium aquatile TaxID=1168082 RepID=A0ABW5DYI8_9PROT
MTRLDLYLIRQVTLATIAIALTLTSAIWLTQSLRFIDLTLNRGMPVGTFLQISALVVPNFLTVILPIALFAAILFALAKMQGDSELPVMRAIGLSPARIARPVLIMMLIFTGIGYGLTLWGLPTSYRAFKDLQAEIRNSYAALLIQEGVFTQIDKGVTLFVRNQGEGGNLSGILVHDERIADRPSTYLADKGTLVATPTGPRLTMVGGSRQELSRKDGRVSLLYFDSYAVDIGRVAGAPALRERESTELYVDELFDDQTVRDPRKQAAYRTEAHQRLAGPLFTPMYVLIALAAMLAGEHSRRGFSKRVLLATVIAASIQGLGFGLANLAGRNVAAVPLLYLLPVVTTIIAFYILSTGRFPRLPTRRSSVAPA